MDVVYWKNSGWYLGPCDTQEHAHPGIQIYAGNEPFEANINGQSYEANFFVIPPLVKHELHVEQTIVQQSVCRVCPYTLKVMPLARVKLRAEFIDLCIDIDRLSYDVDLINQTREHLLNLANIKDSYYQVIDSRIYKALSYIHEIRSEQMTLSNLSQHIHLSESHCKKLFKEQVGISLQNYIQWYRLRLVFQLIHEMGETASAISEAGFSDQSHFSRLFKRHFGWTPMQFLKPDGLVNVYEAEEMYKF